MLICRCLRFLLQPFVDYFLIGSSSLFRAMDRSRTPPIDQELLLL